MLLLFTLIGCEILSGTYYFYSWIDEEDSTSVATITYKNGGYTIIMSRGISGTELTRDAASDLIGTTTFELKIDGVSINPATSKSVDDLGSGYHVVQNFETGRLSRGEYEVFGKTTWSDQGGGFREETVTVTVR
jgi:hypothetical protein